MSNFKGYLLKFGNTEFPHKYLAQSPTFAPNQRTEAEAYRDANNDLHRVTISNYKSKLEFSTIPVNLEEKMEIQNCMAAGLIDSVQRKYRVTYWNDEDNEYKTGMFYVPDVKFNPRKITSDTIEYDGISFSLIEY